MLPPRTTNVVVCTDPQLLALLAEILLRSPSKPVAPEHQSILPYSAIRCMSQPSGPIRCQCRTIEFGESTTSNMNHQYATLLEDTFASSVFHKQMLLRLDYNNMLDAKAAWDVVRDLRSIRSRTTDKVGCRCQTPHALRRFQRLVRQSTPWKLWSGDPISAFGGILATDGVLTSNAQSFLKNSSRLSLLRFCSRALNSSVKAGSGH